jgi:hypothetical protein
MLSPPRRRKHEGHPSSLNVWMTSSMLRVLPENPTCCGKNRSEAKTRRDSQKCTSPFQFSHYVWFSASNPLPVANVNLGCASGRGFCTPSCFFFLTCSLRQFTFLRGPISRPRASLQPLLHGVFLQPFTVFRDFFLMRLTRC